VIASTGPVIKAIFHHHDLRSRAFWFRTRARWCRRRKNLNLNRRFTYRHEVIKNFWFFDDDGRLVLFPSLLLLLLLFVVTDFMPLKQSNTLVRIYDSLRELYKNDGPRYFHRQVPFIWRLFTSTTINILRLNEVCSSQWNTIWGVLDTPKNASWQLNEQVILENGLDIRLDGQHVGNIRWKIMGIALFTIFRRRCCRICNSLSMYVSSSYFTRGKSYWVNTGISEIFRLWYFCWTNHDRSRTRPCLAQSSFFQYKRRWQNHKTWSLFWMWYGGASISRNVEKHWSFSPTLRLQARYIGIFESRSIGLWGISLSYPFLPKKVLAQIGLLSFLTSLSHYYLRMSFLQES
jgi:hypothetical protein